MLKELTVSKYKFILLQLKDLNDGCRSIIIVYFNNLNLNVYAIKKNKIQLQLKTVFKLTVFSFDKCIFFGSGRMQQIMMDCYNCTECKNDNDRKGTWSWQGCPCFYMDALSAVPWHTFVATCSCQVLTHLNQLSASWWGYMTQVFLCTSWYISPWLISLDCSNTLTGDLVPLVVYLEQAMTEDHRFTLASFFFYAISLLDASWVMKE